MSVSSDRDHFFQTSTSLAESDRKRRKASNTHGDPIKFPSKLLALTINKFLDPSGGTGFVAEAAGSIASINLPSGEITRIGRGSQAPITCLASYGGNLSASDPTPVQLVFAGGWDKSISRFDLRPDGSAAPKAVSQTAFQAHSDFVKCLAVARTPDKQLVLLSGGADGDVNIWTLEGKRLASLKPQSRGVECIALDPFSTPESPRIFFATSQREIYSFVLPDSTAMSGIQLSEPIIQHETSVYKLEFDNDGDLWTASADKTAKRLVRENGYIADTSLVHPDFVRDIVIDEPSRSVITACRDEEVRVWNSGTGQLLHVFTGHFEEVTGLAITGSTLISVSIDATLRKWSLALQDLQKAIQEAKNPKLLKEEVPQSKNDFGLTEEEEAQLRALMEDEEAEALDKMANDEQ